MTTLDLSAVPPRSITAMIAAPLALLYAGLGLAVSYQRLTRRLGPATVIADHPRFVRLQRAHGNLGEHAPFVLLLLFILERTGAPAALLWTLGIVFWSARGFHVLGMLTRLRRPLQPLGASLTYLSELALGVILALRALG